MVCGVISGRNYSEGDIFDPALYPRMKEEPLLNDDDELVIPVRKVGQPHFRRIGIRSFGERVGRSENNPTHNDCVKYLYDELCKKDVKKVVISTYVFLEDGSREEQVIFSTLPDSEYRWFMEADARIAFADEKYIQPDLAGRDANRFFPRASCPNVIIEVIRTHEPDEGAFERLYDLSKTNALVLFYVIGGGSKGGRLNTIRCVNGVCRIRVSHYLIAGQSYENGFPRKVRRPDEALSHWYEYLVNSYFKKAMDKAT